jgi:hypothetical protein
LISQIVSLAGSLSLATLAESESLTLNSEISSSQSFFGKYFNLYCRSALANYDKLIKLSGKNQRQNVTTPVGEEEKIIKRIISDLNGARVVARY